MSKNQTKHTPGPWVLMHTPFSDADNGIDLKGNNGNTLIATFPTPTREDGVAYIPGDEDAANLLLIAAAPELLEALKDLADCGSQEHDDNPMDRTCSPDDPQDCALCQARAAIAKAEGKE